MASEPAVDSGRRWLTPRVRGIGAASLLADLGHEVPSISPYIVQEHLTAISDKVGVRSRGELVG